MAHSSLRRTDSDMSMSSDSSEVVSPAKKERRPPTAIQTEARPRANRIKKSGIYFYPTIRIGHGGTATVYKGYFRDPENEAAIKCIAADYYTVYKNEIKIWKQVDDSLNIVRLKDYQSWMHNMKQEYYIAMELAITNLGDVVRDKISPRSALVTYIKDASEGLSWIFSKKIIHRDVKPDNILIFANRAKLGDFGVSKKLHSMTEGSDSTGKTTLDWAAPEVIEAIVQQKTFPNKPSQDIFSLGLTCYYTLNGGVHPFGEIFRGHNILHNKPSIMLDVNSSSYNENKLVFKMLKMKPEARPSIQEVLRYPLFWNEARSLKFIVAVAAAYENKSEDSVVTLRRSVDTKHSEFLPRWISYIPEIRPYIFLDDPKFYNHTSVFKLVELIRDKHTHYQKIDKTLYGEAYFGTNGEFDECKYINYFLGKFPYLVIFLYEIIPDRSFIMRVPRSLLKEYYE